MADRRDTATNISNTWLGRGAQLQTYPIDGWLEGHSFKHLQYMAGRRGTVSNTLYPVAVAVVALITIEGKTGADGVKLHGQ